MSKLIWLFLCTSIRGDREASSYKTAVVNNFSARHRRRRRRQEVKDLLPYYYPTRQPTATTHIPKKAASSSIWSHALQSSSSFGVALYNFNATASGQLSFFKGDKLKLYHHNPGKRWIKATLRGKSGTIPSNYIKTAGHEPSVLSKESTQTDNHPCLFVQKVVESICAPYSKGKDNHYNADHKFRYDQIKCVRFCESAMMQPSKSPRLKLAQLSYMPSCGVRWKQFVRQQFCVSKHATCTIEMIRRCGSYQNQLMWRYEVRSEIRYRAYYDACHACIKREMWGVNPPKDFACWKKQENAVCEAKSRRHHKHIFRVSTAKARILSANITTKVPEIWRHELTQHHFKTSIYGVKPLFVAAVPTKTPTPAPTTLFPTPAPTKVLTLDVWLRQKAGLHGDQLRAVSSDIEEQNIKTVAQLQSACCSDRDSGTELEVKLSVPLATCENVERAFDSC